MPLTRIQSDALKDAITSSNIADGTVATADLASGAVTAPKLAAGAVESYMAASGTNFMFRNKIINGDMNIAQRGLAVPYTWAGTIYNVDRWRQMGAADVTFNSGKNLNGITPPAGFSSYYGIQVVTATASTTTGSYQLQQFIEGLNIRDLGWGTASAKPVTVSFWVRASTAGEYPVGITNANDYSYTTKYTITAADTWEKKTITIPGPTAGTWNLTTAERGIDLHFNLGSGSGSTVTTTTVDQWQAAYKLISTTSIKLSTLSGATWYITGVQLEAGTVATPFEVRPYGTELALCQRYCVVYGNPSSSYERFGVGNATSTTVADVNVFLPVQMRTTPTISTASVGNFYIYHNSALRAVSAVSVDFSSSKVVTLTVTTTGGLTGGGALSLVAAATSNAYIQFLAEL